MCLCVKILVLGIEFPLDCPFYIAMPYAAKHFVQNGVVNGVSDTSFSIGYTGLDTVYESTNDTKSPCRAKMASMINKAGNVVSPSVKSAQAAVRSGASSILYSNLCPGFGLCGNIQDGSDDDVWPISTVTVTPDYIAFFPASACLIRKS